MTRANHDYPRQADEEYNTPAWVAVPIARWLASEGVRNLWEPAPGKGQLARALVACGFGVRETHSDFLLTTTWPSDRDALVTNPPFGRRGEIAEYFIRHTVRELRAPIAAFLLRVDYDSAKTRRDIFGECPSFFGKIVLLDRIVWFERKGAKPSENHAWFIWDRSGRLDGGEPCIMYQMREPNADGSRQVGDADQGRDRDRGARRRVASPARQG